MTKIFLIILLFLGHLYSASFNCDKAATNIEKSICNSKDLNRLDMKLSIKYNFIKKRISDDKKNIFIKGQRDWIKERNRCNNEDCLVSIYKDRISKFEVKYSTILFDYPDENATKNICASLAKNPKLFIQKHKLKTSYYQINQFDINNDDITEKVEIDKKLGTRYTIGNSKQTIYPKRITFNDDDRWAYQTIFLEINDKVFGLYTYSYDYSLDTIKPMHMSYINQSNEEYLMCRFENRTVERMTPNNKINNSQEICALVDIKTDSTDEPFRNYPSFLGTGRLKQIKLTKSSELNSAYFEKTYTNSWSLYNNKEESFDYDNDGKQETIIQIEHSSTKGRMCDVIHFDEVISNENKPTVSRELLLKIQGVNLHSSYPTCCSHSGFFKYKNQIYYEEIKDKKHNILQIKDNKVSTVCTGEFKTITSVKD